MMRASVFTASLAAMLMAGCAMTPDADLTGADAIVDRAGGPFASASSEVFTAEGLRDDWWRLYDSPDLDRLIADAFAHNNDIAAASANLRAARARLGEARSALWPSTALGGSANYGRQSAAAQDVPGPLPDTESYDAGLDVAYELDLFGRVGSAVDAARADADVAEAARDSVRIAVAAETARAYADICSANRQIAVAEQTIDLQTQTFELTVGMEDAGRGTSLDVARAQAALEASRATLPQLRAARDSASYRLGVLTGRPPAEGPALAGGCATAPRLEALLPVGDGAALLGRRPDVREAERRLDAELARVGVSAADLYPRIALGGSIGTSALSFDDLGSDQSFRFGLGPLISWSFPNMAAAQARVEAAQATADAALAQFQQAMLIALQEAETALTNYANELDRTAALRRARDAAAEAARVSRLRFDNGAENFLAVLDAERTLATADAQLAQSEALLSTFQIDVFRALGGGWQPDL
jgi:NodT family efflux transporter outer membrane factor (OMF) lipoprotein